MIKLKTIILLISITAGVFSPFFVRSENLHIVINEVMYDPEGADLGYEWIELFNPSYNAVDLAGWEIEAGGSSFDSTLSLPAEEPIILNPQSFYLIGEQNVSGANLNVDKLGFQNGGSATDGIRILNSNGTVVDTLLYDEPNSNDLPDDSGNPGTSFAVDASSGSSLGRNGQGTDTDDSAQDFKEYTDPTPGEINESFDPPEDYSTDIVINEFLPNPKGPDSDGEFIELKNLGSSSVDISEWIVSDSSQTAYVIDSADFTSTDIIAGGFFVVDREISGIALNNSGGDQIELYQPDGTLLDEVFYSGSIEEGESYSRQSDGNFIWTTTPTPAEENIFTTYNQSPVADAGSNIQAQVGESIQFDGSDSYDPDDDLLTYHWDFGDGNTASSVSPSHEYSTPGNYLVTLTVDDGLLTDSDSITVTIQENLISIPPGGYSGAVIINEIFPNPEGLDSEGEFIELKNIGEDPVDILGWQIGDASSTSYQVDREDFSSTIIEAGGFFVVYREISGVVLNNSGGDQAVLYHPNEEEEFSVKYTGSAPEGKSYSLLSGEWIWTTTPTPGEENIFFTNNQPPVAKMEVVSEAKVGREITFDASDSLDPDGDSLEYHWDFGDGNTAEGAETRHTYKEAGSFTAALTVADSEGAASDVSQTIVITDYNYSDKILINELMINVAGSDSEGEWIELVNLEDREVNLIGWQLADLKNYFAFTENTFIGPQEYLVVSRTESRITLNNSGDTIYLINPRGEIVSGVSYSKAKKDVSFARENFSENWVWTDSPTPGYANEITEIEQKEEDQDNEESVKTKGKEIFAGSITKVKELEKGAQVQVEGWVTVEPGILGSQKFYILQEKGGIQIYSSKKDFPELQLGDYIQVTGKLSEASGEKKINTSTSEDIVVLEPQEIVPEPIIITNEEIGESLEGALITIEGNIVDQKGQSFYVDYGGSDEIKISIKSTTEIEKPKLEDGQLVRVTGIVSQSKDIYQILPRYQEDIVLPGVLGAYEESDEVMEIPPVSEKKRFVKYLYVLGAGVIIAGAGLLAKKYSLWERVKNVSSKK